MKLSFRGFILILFGLVCWATPDQSVVAQTPSSVLACRIESERQVYQIGEIPCVQVIITNQTDQELLIVRSLDGSGLKRRYPYCHFEIIGPDGEPKTISSSRMCVYVNPLRKTDFVKILPLGDFNLYPNSTCSGSHFADLIDSKNNFKEPGEYRIRFHYSTESDELDSWRTTPLSKTRNIQISAESSPPPGVLKKSEEQVLHLLRKVPKTSIQSNELRITFVESETSTSQ